MMLPWLLPLSAALSGSAGAEEKETKTDLIYFAMVDRFANGSLDNDQAVDTSNPQAFHGGDVQGILNHLDHIQAMGIQTIWLSPLALSQTEHAGPWGAYHGYWITDHLRMDPRYGSFDTLAGLADELHSRDMRLILDMVYNHVGYSSVLPDTHPEWFHSTGDIVDWSDPVQRQTHRVHGLPDLDQSKPEVLSYLSQATELWLEKSRADGIRVDAMGHMDPEFIARLRQEIGDENLWILGEDFHGDPAVLAQTAAEAKLDAIFDFPLYYAMTDVFCRGQSMGRLASILSLDRLYLPGTEHITFLDNHDLPRIATLCSSRPDQMGIALHTLFSLRGTPSITYGSEVPMTGAEEPSNRGDMPWNSTFPLASEIAQLQELRTQGPRGLTTDKILYLAEESLLLLRNQADESLLVLIHLGDQELRLDWPEELENTLIRHSSLFTDGKLQTREDTERPDQILGVPRSVSQWWISSSKLINNTTVTLSYSISDVPEHEGSDLRIVGGGPELGNWIPQEGLRMEHRTAGEWQGSVDLPAGSVIAWHPVLVYSDGEVDWDVGADHFSWLPTHQNGGEEEVLISAEHRWGKETK